MKTIRLALPFLCGIMMLLHSCQNGIEDMSDLNKSDKVALSFCIGPFYTAPFDDSSASTRSVDVATVCSQVAMAVYQNSKLDTVISQCADDGGFKAMSVSLKRGQYQILMLAHNLQTLPDFSTPSLISFGQGNMSDILYWYGEINVERSASIDVAFRRIVAKVEITTTDSLPSKARQIYLWYSGGSYILDASTGAAARSINDSKTMALTDADLGKPLSVSFYTLPNQNGALKELIIHVSDKNGNILEGKDLKNIPIKANHITRLSGKLDTY